uniref:Uncharacterized protein n=1 Tax=Arundo donax TaxID=35708 RepID=A0A0A9EXD7_ARUDO
MMNHARHATGQSGKCLNSRSILCGYKIGNSKYIRTERIHLIKPQGKEEDNRTAASLRNQKMDESTAEITAATMLPRTPVWSLKPLPAVLSLAGVSVNGVILEALAKRA